MLRHLFLASLCATLMTPCGATTMWAARGEGITQNAETLVVRNRDDLPSEQAIIEMTEEDAFRFKALVVGNKQSIDSGLNEKGLFISYATVATVPRATRRNLSTSKYKSNEGWSTLEWVLHRCESVKDALRHPEVFRGYPWTYLLADAHEIAFIEALPNGKLVIQRTESGVLTHTNHYTEEKSLAANENANENSETRLARIRGLLDAAPKPFTLNDLAKMAMDTELGKDLAIFREGSKPHLPRTLATIVVRYPRTGKPELSIRYLEHPETDMEHWTNFKEAYPGNAPIAASIVSEPRESIRTATPSLTVTPVKATASGAPR